MGKLVANKVQTPDGTILESFHRHDYKEYTDTLTGELCIVDGGLDYQRRSLNVKDISVTTDDPYELQREAFTWGTYGKCGTLPLQRIPLKDLTFEHIYAILETQKQIEGTYVEELFRKELQYREGFL